MRFVYRLRTSWLNLLVRSVFLALLLTFAPLSFSSEYKGRMINAHLHVLGNLESNLLFEELSKAGVEAAILMPKFYKGGGPYGGDDASSSDEQMDSIRREYPTTFFPLMGLQRGELCKESHWSDPNVINPLIAELDKKLSDGSYYGAGELIVVHWAYGKNVDSPGKNKNCSELNHDISSPLVRGLLDTLKRYDKPLVMHMEGDPIAVSKLRALLNLGAKIVWAHNCGRSHPEVIRDMLSTYKNLFCDLANMDDKGFYGSGKPRLAPFSYLIMKDGRLDPAQLKLMVDYPDRFMVGSDVAHAEGFRKSQVSRRLQRSRLMLGQLPINVADRVAYKNAVAIFGLPIDLD